MLEEQPPFPSRWRGKLERGSQQCVRDAQAAHPVLIAIANLRVVLLQDLTVTQCFSYLIPCFKMLRLDRFMRFFLISAY